MTVLWKDSEILKATGGESQTKNWTAGGVSLDSRHLQKGDLFVAIKGPVADGHHFAKNAFANGAGAALVDHYIEGVVGPQVVVKDTEKALVDLAHYARLRTHAKVIGVTGSFGKTSTKEALGLMLRDQGKTTLTQSSFNNHWGVPLSVARMAMDDDYGVFEMGMNHPGEMTELSKIVQPDIALITTVAGGHAGNFSSIKEIARAKAEIFEGMKPGTTAVLNRDNEFYDYIFGIAQEHQLDVVSFGEHPRSDFKILQYRESSNGLSVSLACLGETIQFVIPVYAKHWAWNSAGALACVHLSGGNFKKAAESLSRYEIPVGRGRLMTVPYTNGAITIIDDSYNAGPDSMKAAIEVLGKISPGPNGRKIVVLGDMLELGNASVAEHKALYPYMKEAGVDSLFACGKEIRSLIEEVPDSLLQIHSEDIGEIVPSLLSYVHAGDVILIKGSRGQRDYKGKMSQCVDALEKKSATMKRMEHK